MSDMHDKMREMRKTRWKVRAFDAFGNPVWISDSEMTFQRALSIQRGLMLSGMIYKTVDGRQTALLDREPTDAPMGPFGFGPTPPPYDLLMDAAIEGDSIEWLAVARVQLIRVEDAEE